MKIETLAALQAVLRCGTFAAAAEELSVTPSAISMRMKQLEIYLGQPLFDRSGKQIQPTPLAIEIAQATEGALRALETLRRSNTLAIEGTIRLGIIEAMQPVVLPGTLRRLRERHPRLELRLARGRTATLTAAVKAGELDAALVAQPPKGGSARLRWDPMMRRELVLVAPPDSDEASLAKLFRKYEWIRYDRDTATGTMAARFVSTHVGDIRGSLEFGSPAAIVAMVSAGLGISILQIADPTLLRCYPVRVIRLGSHAPILQMSLVTRKIDSDSRALQALRSAMQAASAAVASYPAGLSG